MPITLSISDNRFPALAARFPAATSQIVRKTASDIEGMAKVDVPVGETGNLRASIQAVPEDDQSWVVYTNMVYAARIEFGFVGADSLGRVYNQAPQPYLTPAVESARPGFIEALSHLERLL